MTQATAAEVANAAYNLTNALQQSMTALQTALRSKYMPEGIHRMIDDAFDNEDAGAGAIGINPTLITATAAFAELKG